jgi:hypothetical protein
VQCEISNITIGRAAWEACSATWNWVTTQHLLWDQGKAQKTLIELASRRTFRTQLTSSQQSSIKSANPNISPYTLLLYFLFFSFFSQQVIYFYNYLYVHMIWISNKLYKTLMEGMQAYVNKHAHKHTYLYPIVVWKSDVLLGLLLIQ